MFSFLNPIFLWAAAAAIIPLVLHMMQRRRIVRIPFSTIRFLQLAEKRSSRRIRLENFLLWLFRTVLMLLLALAFAVPMLRTQAFGSFLSKAQRDIAIVLDGSYSMGYDTGKDTVWNRAIQCAIALVEGLDEGDRICVFSATDDAIPVVEQLTGDREFVIGQIKGLEVGATSCRLCPATIAAYDALRQEERRREREIHVITDGQALSWTGFQRAEDDKQKTEDGEETAREVPNQGGWEPEKIDRKTAFFVTLTGVPAPENAAPMDIDIQPQLIMSDMPSKVRVRMGHTGPIRDGAISIFVDGEEMSRRAAVFGGEDSGDITFALPPLKAGIHAAGVETPPDNLQIDNRFHFLIRARERLPSLCVGSEDDALYLVKALNPGVELPSALDAKRIESGDLAGENLALYSCIFLCNALPLPGQAVMQLEQYVQAGGMLVIFPGNNATTGDYQAWKILPCLPTAVRDVPTGARKRTLRWEAPQHPLLRNLTLAPGNTPVITISRELAWEEPHKAAQTLIFAGPEHPFLISRNAGKGQVFLFSVPADRSWSSFPLSPFFLPLAHQLVQYGAGISSDAPYLWAARSLSLADHLPSATRESSLLAPDKNNVPIRATLVENKTILTVENLLAPGVYLLSNDGADAEPALAINVERGESDLTPVKRETIPDILGIRTAHVADGKDEMLRLINEHRVGRTLGEQALWLAFVLGLVEVFYANRKTKATRSLSETLGIEASGKVKTI